MVSFLQGSERKTASIARVKIAARGARRSNTRREEYRHFTRVTTFTSVCVFRSLPLLILAKDVTSSMLHDNSKVILNNAMSQCSDQAPHP